MLGSASAPLPTPHSTHTRSRMRYLLSWWHVPVCGTCPIWKHFWVHSMMLAMLFFLLYNWDKGLLQVFKMEISWCYHFLPWPLVPYLPWQVPVYPWGNSQALRGSLWTPFPTPPSLPNRCQHPWTWRTCISPNGQLTRRGHSPPPAPALCLPWVAPSSSPIPCVAWTSICSLKLSQDSNA